MALSIERNNLFVSCFVLSTNCPFPDYVVEKCEFGSDSWRSVPGFCPSTSFTVRGLDANKKYNFRIKAESIYGTSEPLDSGPVVARSPYDPPGPPGKPTITSYSPSSCNLVWTPPSDTGGRPVTGKPPLRDICFKLFSVLHLKFQWLFFQRRELWFFPQCIYKYINDETLKKNFFSYIL